VNDLSACFANRSPNLLCKQTQASPRSTGQSNLFFLLEFVDILGVMFTGERRRIVVREREGVWLVKNEWRRRGWLVVGDGVLRF